MRNPTNMPELTENIGSTGHPGAPLLKPVLAWTIVAIMYSLVVSMAVITVIFWWPW